MGGLRLWELVVRYALRALKGAHQKYFVIKKKHCPNASSFHLSTSNMASRNYSFKNHLYAADGTSGYDASKMIVAELRIALKKHGISPSGKKAVLVAKIKALNADLAAGTPSKDSDSSSDEDSDSSSDEDSGSGEDA